MTCLNIDNKEVKAALDELTKVLGDEDAAYYLVSENNGYAIDQAPNGAQSKLFSDLLDHYNGNREQAIRTKAKVFTDEFKNWFGDWTNVLKSGDIIFGHPTIGKTYSLEAGRYRDKFIDWDVEFNTKRDKWIEEHSNTKKGTLKYKKARNEYLIYPEKHPDYVEFVTSEWERVKNKTKQEGKILFASPHTLLKMFPQDFNRIINLEYSDFVSRNVNRGGKEKESTLWKEGIDATISKIEGIPVETLKENQYFEDYLDKYLGVSKVVDENGEPDVSAIITGNKIRFNKEGGVQYEYRPAEEFATFFVTNNREGNATSKELITKLLPYLPNNSIVYKILNQLLDSNIDVVFSDSVKEVKYMAYNYTDNNIVINSTVFGKNSMGYNAESFAHEIVHAYTVRTMYRIQQGIATDREKQLYKSLSNLYEYYQNKFSDKKVKYKQGEDVIEGFIGKYYGLTDIYEFTAELLTNREFMEMLKYDNDNLQSRTFYKKLKDFIRDLVDLLGFKRDVVQLYDNMLDLFTYNVENNITEDDFVNSESDLDERMAYAVTNMETQFNKLSEEQITFDKVTEDLNQTINTALTSRLKIYNHPDPIVKQQTIKQMEWQIQNITQNLASNYDNIVNFLQQSADEIKVTSEFLIKAKKNNEIIDDDRLNDLDQNFFSFYCGVIDDIVQKLIYQEPYREIVGKDGNGDYKLDKLIRRAKTYQQLLNEGRLIVKGEIAKNASRILKETGMEVGAVVIYNYEQSDPSTHSKDISWLTYQMGAGDKIKDECVKTIFYLVNGVEEKVRHDVYAKQDKLSKLLSKVNHYNQMQLFEVDDDGNTTGYFVRSRNYGKFESAYKKEMEDICMQLGVDITDINLPENREIRIEFNKLRNKWLSQHCERRFTAEYYEAFNHLSNEAQQQRESIQLNIRNLQNKARDEYGIVKLERLTPAERDQLKKHQLEKKQLASLYDINGRKKQGIQLQIAEELTELNKKLSEGIVMTKNSKAYERERDKVMNDSKLTKEQKEEWLELNSKTQYKEEFYKKLDKVAKKYYGENYAALSERRRALLSMFRDDATGEIDVYNMPQSTKNALSAISREMTRIRKSKKSTTLSGEYNFEDIADIVPTKQWYEDKRREYDSKLNDDPEAAQLWLQANAYTIKTTDSNGKVTIKTVPKSWYTKMVPKDKSMIERVPNNNWLEVSEDSPFYNKAYYQAQVENPELKDEYWIPKKDLYDSTDRYKRIQNNPDMKALYDELLNTMQEANDQYTNLNKKYPYRTPQMSGSLYRYIGYEWRSRHGLDALTAPFKGFGQWLADKLSVRNDDKGFNKALTKPNGERLNLIPQNYIKRLDNPGVLSANLVGDVVEYYKSAMEWKYKKEIQPKVELLRSHVQGKTYLNRDKTAKSGETNMAKYVKAFIDMNLYDIKQQTVTVSFGNNPSGKMFGVIPYKGSVFNIINYDFSKPREVNITKMLAILRTLGTFRNLALNLWCALTGGFTALFSHTVNSLVGRYYNPVDAAYAFKDILVDLLINVPNKFGITKHKPFISKCMEYFEVGAEMQLDPTNRNHLVNMANKHWGFGIYTLQDHLIKGQILGSIMNNYKLVVDKDGNRKFMSREEYKQKNKLKTFRPGDLMDWNFGDKLSFRDAITFVDGKMVAKDPANQKAVEDVRNEIAYLARSLAQSADGQLTNLQRSIIFSHAAGQFMMMHRQYLPAIIQERFTMSKQFDYQTKRYKEAVYQTPYRIFMEAIEANENILRAFSKSYTSDPVARENLAKIAVESSMFVVLAQIIRPLLSSSADDDKKNKLKQLLAYVIERTSFEVMAPYNIADMVRNVKSPSPIISYIENMTEFASAPINMLLDYSRATIKGESFSNKVIHRGAYKGMTEFERSMWKLTPFKNLIELKDIQSKRNYYQKQILGE